MRRGRIVAAALIGLAPTISGCPRPTTPTPAPTPVKPSPVETPRPGVVATPTPPPATPVTERVARIKGNMGWEPPVAPGVREVPPPELRLLRYLDPQGFYTAL